ncbi:MAG TPA: APC family permease [Candidatus Acidoferrum sp.]|nr:APC family permease [Candidatus Acidoferrum sp.]
MGRESIQLPQNRRVTMFALACLIFFTTCGGAFGLEPLIGAVGPGLAFVLIILTPLLWSLPTALMAAELATIMPDEGGYYVWVRETFGAFWAVQHSCWMMTCAVLWLAIYPVLFVGYLTFFFPALAASSDSTHFGMSALIRWLVAALVIAAGMVLNLFGARAVGRWAKVGAYIVLGAFVLLLLIWLKRGPGAGSGIGIIGRDLSAGHKGLLLLGLSYIIFNCSGWENASTYAGEVDNPQRNYPRALVIGLLVLVLCYLLPVVAGISITTDPAIWSSDAGWPVIAQLIGGTWLGKLMAAAGLVSTFGLFNAQLLYASRLPFVLACDGWLPKFLAKVSPTASAPRMAIICFSAVGALFAAFSFGSLAVIQCLLYSAALTLEFLALLVLRVRRPHVERSFRVPGGWLGMAYVCMSPFAFAALLLYATLRDWRSFPEQLFVVAAILGIGVGLYFARRSVAVPRSAGGFSQVSSSPPT